MSDIRDKLFNSIYGQESSYGKADTRLPNAQKVRGPMQVQQATFDSLKRMGRIPAHFDNANDEHNMAAGRAYIDYLGEKFGDDPAKIAAGYYAGEKVVAKDGTIQNFKNLQRPQDPDTYTYVSQVLKRAGLDNTLAAAVTPVAAPAAASKINLDDLGSLRATPVSAAAKTLIKELTPMPAQAEPDPTVAPAAAAAAGASARQGAQEVQDSTFLDKARATYPDTFLGAVGRWIIDGAVQQHLPRDPGYRQDPKILEGRTSDEIEELQDVGSLAEETRVLQHQDMRRERTRAAGLGGAGSALLAGLFAGAPEGVLTGMAAFRGLHAARLASGQLAAEGRVGAAVVSNLAENAGVNVATTGIMDAVEGYQGPEDYAMGFALGALGTAAAVPSVNRAVMAAESARVAQAATETVHRNIMAAAERLGPNATPAELAAEARRIGTAEASAIEQANLGALPADRRLIDVDDNGMLRVENPLVPEQSASALPGSARMAPSDNMGPMEKYSIKDHPILYDINDAEQRTAILAYTAPKHLPMAEGMKLSRAVDALLKGDSPGLLVHGLPHGWDETAAWLQKKFMSDQKVIVMYGDFGAKKHIRGDSMLIKGATIVRIHAPAVMGNRNAKSVLLHEFGHSIFQTQFSRVSAKTRAAVEADYRQWFKEYSQGGDRTPNTVALERTSLGSHVDIDEANPGNSGSLFEYMSRLLENPEGVTVKGAGNTTEWARYWGNFEEMTAEQFGKYIESSIDSGRHSPPAALKKYIVDLFKRLFDLFTGAKERGLLGPKEGFREFYDEVWAINKAQATEARRAEAGLNPDRQTEKAFEPQANIAAGNAVAEKYGLDLLPEGTPLERAEKKAIISMYERADNPAAPWNNIDPKFLNSITDNDVFNVSSTSLRMLKSENPVLRMLAAELVESPAGGAGRRSTAAISKYLHERQFMGNVVNDLQAAYKEWRNVNGGNLAKDFFDGEHWRRFNREVASYTEGIAAGVTPTDVHPAVIQAATSLERAYERMRVGQVKNKTAGWAALPESSKGYMPHRMSPEKVRNMTTAQAQILHSALVDQFVTIEGWDISFSANLASKYIDRVRARALGEYDSPVNIHQVGAADIVEDALAAMGMSRPEIRASMEKYRRGAPGHTKRRIRLDLNAEHADGFRLLDLFETDQLRLLRSQAQRVSGEVALARHGIMGKQGLALARRAIGYGDVGNRVKAQELEAFDQVAAELMGEPFGEQGGKWLNRAVQANALARLGGMGFTQMAEFINGIAHVGTARTLSAIGDVRRLRSEILAASKGTPVNNPILRSLEVAGGAEFGTDSYKLVFPFDNPDLQYQTYGKDTVSSIDRLLRGGAHAQGKLSMWRAIHSAQQRGMAEQIVHKALRYIREGKEDIALADMGFTPEVREAIANELPYTAKFAGNRLVEFDITKMENKAAAEAFIQAVHRGSMQIIQGTFIGETGKWAHSGLLRMMTQFRTFSITSVEKQWGRQRANRGAPAALGILLGSMSLAAPIYMARTYLASVGRDDQEEYLEKQLSYERIARASLNYVALSGLAGDFLDAASTITGVTAPTGGRAGTASEFVGTVVAPAAGLIDDAWKSLQNTKEGTDPSDFLKTLPFSKLPYMLPMINSLGEAVGEE